MNISFIYIVLIVLLFCSCKPAGSGNSNEPERINLDGYYAGMEKIYVLHSLGQEIPYPGSNNSKRVWYHFNYLRIKHDSVFLNKSPISIGPENDTLWSASEGGFYTYTGILERVDSSLLFKLKRISSDYIIEAESDEINDQLEVLKVNSVSGGIHVNGILFRKIKKLENMAEP